MIQDVKIHTHHTARNRIGDLQHAERREVVKQRVGNLRDREHEHEIEEQFDIGHAMVTARRALAQQRRSGCSRPMVVSSRCLFFGRAGLQRQRMQRAAHLPLQRLIDDLMLLHARLAAESFRK